MLGFLENHRILSWGPLTLDSSILTLWYLKNLPQIATTFATEMWNPLTFDHISKIQQNVNKISKFPKSPRHPRTYSSNPQLVTPSRRQAPASWTMMKWATAPGNLRKTPVDRPLDGAVATSQRQPPWFHELFIYVYMGRTLQRWSSYLVECLDDLSAYLYLCVFSFSTKHELDSLRIRGASSPKWPRWTGCSEFVGVKSSEVSHALGF